MMCGDNEPTLRSFLHILGTNVPRGVSTHEVDGYLSIFIMQSEQKQEGEDERKR